MRNPRDFAKPLAIGAPAPMLEIPFKPSRMIHFLDFSNEKMVAKAPEIARVRGGAEAPGWEPFEATLMRAADELHERARISDDTWAALAEHYDEKQLIEVPMLVGHYHMVAFTLNTLGVPLEAGLAGFEE